jgi:uncharacterized protein (TIGR03000 family)
MYTPGTAPAYVTVVVPTPDAQVWIEDNETRQTGTQVRQFVSPPLEPGKPFHYDIRVRWQQGDRPMEQTRSVDVRAGARAMADFNTGQGTPSTQPSTNPTTNTPTGTNPATGTQ